MPIVVLWYVMIVMMRAFRHRRRINVAFLNRLALSGYDWNRCGLLFRACTRRWFEPCWIGDSVAEQTQITQRTETWTESGTGRLRLTSCALLFVAEIDVFRSVWPTKKLKVILSIKQSDGGFPNCVQVECGHATLCRPYPLFIQLDHVRSAPLSAVRSFVRTRRDAPTHLLHAHPCICFVARLLLALSHTSARLELATMHRTAFLVDSRPAYHPLWP